MRASYHWNRCPISRTDSDISSWGNSIIDLLENELFVQSHVALLDLHMSKMDHFMD